MTAKITEATLCILRSLDLDKPAIRWLVKTMKEINLENMRQSSSTPEKLVEELLGRKWPQTNLTARQREEIFWLIVGQSYAGMNRIILLAENSL